MKQLTLLQLLKHGVHFGKGKNKKHPQMDEYIFTLRNNICIFDLEKTLEKIQQALDFLKKLKKEKKNLLVVGTKKQIKDKIQEFASDLGFHYINHRWLGGTLTNFEVINLKLKRLKKLEALKEKGELKKYTKLEQQRLMEEKEKLELEVGGMRGLKELPSALLILDPFYEKIALKEAKRLGLPIIALMNINSNPNLIDYPIPMNTESTQAISYVLNGLKENLSG